MGITERKEREKQQRKQMIIDAAEKIFFTKGFSKATMEDIAREAELSKGTLYLYFKNKEELHWAINIRGLEILHNMHQACYDESLYALENLIKMGEVFVRFSETYKNYFEALLFFEGKNLNKIDSEEIKNAFLSHPPLKMLFELVEKGQQDGSIRQDISINALANTLWAQMMGVLQVIYNKKEIFQIYNIEKHEVINCHFSLLINGIGKNNGKNEASNILSN